MNQQSDFPDILFIAGLGHSGSTVTDLLLGAQEGIVGLGEINVLLKQKTRSKFLGKYDKYPCTCGLTPSDCPVWGPFKDRISNSGDSYGELYKSLIRNVISTHPECTVIVDSSKNLGALKKVYRYLQSSGFDMEKKFKVLHLIKDVRSFTQSEIKNGNKRHIFKIFNKWKRTNVRFDDFFNEKNLSVLRLSYEEIALSTHKSGSKILDFLKMGENSFDDNISDSMSHIIFGNKMRIKNSQRISYDYRWFLNAELSLYYALWPGIRKMNKEWVYGNLGDK